MAQRGASFVSGIEEEVSAEMAGQRTTGMGMDKQMHVDIFCCWRPLHVDFFCFCNFLHVEIIRLGVRYFFS